MGLTKSMRRLVVEYGAHVVAKEMSQIDWAPLAQRLSVEVGVIEGAIQALSEEERFQIWGDIVDGRAKGVASLDVFKTTNWKRLESGALEVLLRLVEGNLVRDPDQLLTIAKVSSQQNQGPAPNHAARPYVNINMNAPRGRVEGFEMIGEELEKTLPNQMAEEDAIRIDLSPRTAQTLKTRRVVREVGDRVIDAERVNAEELRALSAGETTESDE
jgi:hypothetical protein